MMLVNLNMDGICAAYHGLTRHQSDAVQLGVGSI